MHQSYNPWRKATVFRTDIRRQIAVEKPPDLITEKSSIFIDHND